MTTDGTGPDRTREAVAILLVSLAGLLLEIAYTRIISYKLWYYYTYLVIGLALLGIGSGGIAVAIFEPIRRATTAKVVAVCSLWGAISVPLGYLIIARLPIETAVIWDYGSGRSFKNIAALGVVCFVLFATFIAIGIMISVLLGRAGDQVGKLYFADLVGAALACLIAIPLVSNLGPPRLVFLAALVLAATGLVTSTSMRGVVPALTAAVTVVLVVGVVASSLVPDVTPERGKAAPGAGGQFSEWGPVFRVDVVEIRPGDPTRLLLHDGTFGSGIHEFNGDPDSLEGYDDDPRTLPFLVLGEEPDRGLIIGAAGGHEILYSLRNGVKNIEAVELNPVTVSILRDHFADFTGNIATHPDVDLVQADGRSYLARSEREYELIWYVAPDSYAANNAVSSGAFVLSESYLYTSEMIQESLEHLTDDGIMVVQFGELDFRNAPNRTARYVVTARDALEKIGVDDPSQHLAVAVFLTENSGDLSTIIVKKTPFTDDEIARFEAGVPTLPQVEQIYAPGKVSSDNPAALAAAAPTPEAVQAVIDAYPRDISAVVDDQPFFWHFEKFGAVLSDITRSIDPRDPEIAIGERVLLLLLAFAAVYAAIFLLAPFVFVRKQWRALPHKGLSAVYFASLGLAFMLYEISMIQRLAKFLGYPTYSLTVTLASVLVATGIGALISDRFRENRRAAGIGAITALAVLTVFYQFGLDPILDSLQSASLTVRVITTFIVLFPLGLCLGLFMPLGLGIVAHLGGSEGESYAAWAWAINGFFSVMGSVLTTILAMSFGFRAVQYLALGIYVVAVIALIALDRRTPKTILLDEPAVPDPNGPNDQLSPAGV